MSIIRLFTPLSRFSEGEPIHLGIDELNYLKNVMRCKVGDKINIFNSIDGTWEAEIKSFNLMPMLICRTCIKEQSNKLFRKISLGFSILKPKSTDFVIQKATELGVCRIYPLIAERSICRSFNLKRAELIAKEASEQSFRDNVPEVCTEYTLRNFLSLNKAKIILLSLNNQCVEMLDAAKQTINEDVVLIVGPEGGFTQDEYDSIISSCGAIPVTLGEFVLRAETASISALSNYMMSIRCLRA
ncbi:Ribosomal RNA small subunit methyltransferase E [Candidatus Cyrtobacter comes]|uniref:Ribosomal RNA small subunit methyltransferase E n=1 Tax=Candidatus Cyrtobacter comes TaxID=675776 RepID=A0ABU5L8B4_9RICK|nr:RsmE family RNA methyltransferase [Candidatus Cyrtobacter comes]MDZ5762360.1 Ribosomal RNA small subunit methyltransferase E [Candidatus Cyrtobacter comes]